MAPAATDPGGPLWWLVRLEWQLKQRQAQMALMEDYYRGNHPMPFLTKSHDAKMRDEFRNLLEDCRSNFMRLVIDAVDERLAVEGFRVSANSDTLTDTDAWNIWQANSLDQDFSTAIVEALIKGVSYLSVWGGDPYPSIMVEDPLQTIVAYEAGMNFRERAAALKVWIDEWTGDRRANVYLPGGIYKYVQRADVADSYVLPLGQLEAMAAWQDFGGEGQFVPNPTGIVPIIPLRNRPRLLVEGESEIVDAAPTQDRINGELFMRALAGYFGAHRQRWAVGLTIHEDDSGNPVEPFDVAIDKLWTSEDKDTQFGEFSQTDLGGYIKAIEQDILHIAITTRTPRHYLIEQGQSPSGDAIRSAESGLVRKVERKQRAFGEGAEEAIRLARRFAGSTDAPVDSEVSWASPSTPTVGEATDAIIKQFAAGLIPKEAALEALGYTQAEIKRYVSETSDIVVPTEGVTVNRG